MKSMALLTIFFALSSAYAAQQKITFKCIQEAPNYKSKVINTVTAISSGKYSTLSYDDAFNKSPYAKGVVTVPTKDIEFLFSELPKEIYGVIRLRDSLTSFREAAMNVQFSAGHDQGFVIQFFYDTYSFGITLKECTKDK
jgi:hypothetical protein